MPDIYRYTSPVAPKDATGPVAAVYAQIKDEFLLADGPLMTLSRAPELLVCVWALLRESELAGPVPRAERELVAVAVSAANTCPCCVDAHTALGHAGGDHTAAEAVRAGRRPRDPALAALADWAAVTGDPTPGPRPAPPFPAEHTAAFIGTALVTHIINRVTSSLLVERLLPGDLQRSRTVRRVLGAAVRRGPGRPVAPGRSLELLPATAAAPPAWADGPVGTAYAALAGAVASLDVPDTVRARTRDAVAAWDGRPPALFEDPVGAHADGLDAPDRTAVRLAVLAALSPHRIADADVAAWRAATGRTADADLVRLVVLGAFTAADRIQRSLAAAAARRHPAGQPGEA
ncbi:carboxymuconolactone decarboxylase family protein [Nocardiopsis changdeensis]|uniref:Carboxymuconolactone decarboxylase family protein n=1 Tax=Nocardiopsis changdeensis TaxID=2831969 RepID=A0ABX8BT08_9ACTN|nr:MULTISPECIES: carboxymuconolactone decarboxylase family protein [Nocardiopsis]QUX25354.1 carboxymuconolactone decarboxylase family protein [Nocardiopsis changdeensis]QYX35741.1 carboxymuconolactone decarboxylase family protein [Nocardiopsis sp. MT53]